MDININDILVLKKPHPCGSKEWQVLRTGADFRLKCMGCGRMVMESREKTEKSIKEIKRGNQENL